MNGSLSLGIYNDHTLTSALINDLTRRFSVMTSTLASKLTHSLEEVRNRALRAIEFKLKTGILNVGNSLAIHAQYN
jgi:hypothetical protein